MSKELTEELTEEGLCIYTIINSAYDLQKNLLKIEPKFYVHKSLNKYYFNDICITVEYNIHEDAHRDTNIKVEVRNGEHILNLQNICIVPYYLNLIYSFIERYSKIKIYKEVD